MANENTVIPQSNESSETNTDDSYNELSYNNFLD